MTGAEFTDADVAVLKGPRNYGALTTVNPDGSLQSSITWVDAADGFLLVNTAVGRVKDRNLRANPNAAMLVTEEGDAYRWTSFTGRVVDTVGEPEALEHIDALSRRYDGKPWTPKAGQRRVIFRIRPTRVVRYED